MHPIDRVSRQIIGAAINVHRERGPGLLESVYVACLGQELVEMDLDVHIGMPLSLDHKGLHIHRAYVLDLLVENCVIVEVKCVRKISDLHVAQLLTSAVDRNSRRIDPQLQRHQVEAWHQARCEPPRG